MCVDFDYSKHQDQVENHDKPPGYVAPPIAVGTGSQHAGK